MDLSLRVLLLPPIFLPAIVLSGPLAWFGLRRLRSSAAFGLVGLGAARYHPARLSSGSRALGAIAPAARAWNRGLPFLNCLDSAAAGMPRPRLFASGDCAMQCA